MRCQDARQWLNAQHDGDLAQSEDAALQEHLRYCVTCRAFQQYLDELDAMLSPSTASLKTSVPTDNIMLAIQRQKRITQQLEELREQQRTRVARMRVPGTALVAMSFFVLGSLPLLLFAIVIIQTNLAVKALSVLNGVIDSLVILAQYLQEGSLLVTRNNWLLSAVAFAVVIMMGMWLRLMRHPQEA